jgi:uncharacterized protein YhhL (DUF1145 family)
MRSFVEHRKMFGIYTFIIITTATPLLNRQHTETWGVECAILVFGVYELLTCFLLSRGFTFLE